MSKVSVHLIVYNGEKYLPFSLASLKNQSFKDFSVLIIDNASQDESVSMIESFLKGDVSHELALKTTLIKNRKNDGFAPAHNRAIQWSTSEYVFMMNQDVILDDSYLEELVNFLDSRPEAAAASGTIFRWNFEEMNDSSGLTERGKTDSIDTLGLIIDPSHMVVEWRDPENIQTPREVFGVSGALPMYRRSALEAAKVPVFRKRSKLYGDGSDVFEYFDTDFFAYKEDVDLAYRLKLLGYRAYLAPLARAWHDRTAAAKTGAFSNRRKKSAFINFHSYRNHLYFLIKNVSFPIFIRHAHNILLYETVKFFYILFFEQSTLCAFADLAKNFSRMLKKRRYIQKKLGKEGWKNVERWL
ncbi:MAG: glycosyltransferase [Candidatus Jacksonbacteria bacterium]|nr:glycosyltransferase [Candidatus Jacksonbacteria bacterium]